MSLEIAFLAVKNLKIFACGAGKDLTVLNTILQPAAGAKKKLTPIWEKSIVYLDSPPVPLLLKTRGEFK